MDAWGATGKAADADLLDGSDSTSVLRTGATAGGDLAGTYPNPSVGPNAIGSAEIADGSLDGVDTFKLTGNRPNATTWVP